jgi:hypothetical protein
MSSLVSDHDIASAIVKAANDGAYPDSEDVLVAEIQASALSELRNLLEAAGQELRVCQLYPEQYQS